MASPSYDYNLSAYQQGERDWNNPTHMVTSFAVGTAMPDANAYMKPSPSPLPDQQSAGSITPPNNEYSYHYNMQSASDHGEARTVLRTSAKWTHENDAQFQFPGMRNAITTGSMLGDRKPPPSISTPPTTHFFENMKYAM